MATTIEDFRNFSVHDLKRLGMLRDGYNGQMNWTRNGETESTVGLAVRLSGCDPIVLLHYTMTYTGEKISDLVKLHFQKSNLTNHAGGYWMFVCPITGKPCRVLYLDNGHFKSRKALPPGIIYKSQTHTVYFRTITRAFDYCDALDALSDTLAKPYAKEVYRGKPTRRAKQGMKKIERYEQAMEDWLSQQ